MSTLEIILTLFTQLSLLVTCTFLLSILNPFLKSRNKRTQELGQGVLFGIFTLLVMLGHIQIAEGVVFDLRAVIIMVVGAFGGVVPAAVVALFVIVYRLVLGGVGAPVGVGVALSAAALGIGFRVYKKQHVLPWRGALIGLGFANAVQTLLWLFLLPVETARQVIPTIGLPIFLVYPISSWLFGSLLLYQEHQLELEESLNIERNLLRTLIDNVPDYIFIKDKTKRYILSNLAHAHAAGVASPLELIGLPAQTFFPSDYVMHHDADDNAVLLGESIISQARQTMSENGMLIWVSTTKIPLRDTHGNIIGIVGISRDITAHIQAEEAVQREQELLAAQAQMNETMRQFLQSTLDAFPANTIVLENDGSIILVNEPWKHFADENSGLSPVHYLGDNYLSVCDASAGLMSEEAALAAAGIRSVIEGTQDNFYLEYPCHSPVEKRWFGMHVSPFFETVPRRVVVAHINVTERKRVEEALQENEAKLQTFFEVLPVGISVFNSDGRIIEINPALERILDFSLDGLLAGKYQSRKYLSSDGRLMELSEFPSVRAQVEQRPIHDVVVGVVKEDETTVWISISAAPLPGANSDVIAVTLDITERKQAEAQAFALTAEQQRGRLLREFITDVSHDFRTPLTIIGTSAFLISKTTDPAKLTQYSQRIEDQMSRLRLLLDNFVELAHLEQEASSLLFQPTDLVEMVKTIIQLSEQEAVDKCQRIDYQGETDSVPVLGNPTALTKAITNVVANALHYTPDEGKITLRLYAEGENAVIEVADTGIGIQAIDLPHIFDSFYRADSARSIESGGAGLGLSIAKKSIELMKGHIEVESEFGVGSVFKIILPIYQQIIDARTYDDCMYL